MQDMTGRGQRPPPTLLIVVPCFNEEEVFPETLARLSSLLDSMCSEQTINGASRILFVDDGSRDRTWCMVEESARRNRRASGIKLAANVGHQRALLAGLLSADADVTVSIDADLQDDENCIRDMVRSYREGADVVYGVRTDRSSDSVFKRESAKGFYRLMALLGTRVVDNHADFRLLSRRATEHLRQFDESNLFLRGIVPLLGFRSETVGYVRRPRLAGESKYPLRKMLLFAWEGITSFSVRPLRLVALIGLLTFVGTLTLSAWVVLAKVIGNQTMPGWASTVLPIYFLGGVQILCLAVVGEYIGKIYSETKRRPKFFVEASVDGSAEAGDQCLESRHISVAPVTHKA